VTINCKGRFLLHTCYVYVHKNTFLWLVGFYDKLLVYQGVIRSCHRFNHDTMKLDPLFRCTRLYVDDIRIYEVTHMLPILTDLTYLYRWETFVRPFMVNLFGQHMHVNVHVCSGNPPGDKTIIIITIILAGNIIVNGRNNKYWFYLPTYWFLLITVSWLIFLPCNGYGRRSQFS